jgi:hypothetical protein
MKKYDAFSGKELAVCSTEDIENIIIQADLQGYEELVKIALDVRLSNLNSKFNWTDENRKQLLRLNSKLIDCFDKLKAEAMTIFQSLQNRVDAKDGFLYDLEIEAYVIPAIYYEDEDGKRYEKDDGIEDILMKYWDDWIMNFSIRDGNISNNLYFNRELNWNIECLDGIFNEHYISYSIHELLTHTKNWSFSDVLKINHLTAEIKIIYQHYTDV